MSRTLSTVVLGLVAVACVAPAFAQTAAAPAMPEVGNTVLIARYTCNAADHAKVDQLFKDVAAPTLNRMVAEGKLVTWAILATHIGGPDTRAIYVWAKDPIALLKARAEYLPEIMAKPGWAEVQRACPTTEVSISNMIMRSQPAAK